MLLTVENLTKVYIKKKIINNVSFSMKKGEILGVLGKSGAGKSTIGKILLQLSRPTTGTILFEGKTLSEVPRKDIQAIFQDPYSALNPSLKIGEILEEPLIANGVFQKKEERRKKVEETLVKVGLLESDYEKYPEELSGGQQQRVCIAGAIILSPKLIICDEPIASLDLAIQLQILDLINKINQEEGISFIFITHNLPAVYRIADRILLLYHGEVQEIQEVEDFFNNPKSEYGKKFLQYLNLTKNVTNVTDFFI
ncbi:dipeptide/oligopeptide/nickel ABC transporter ATP-binding protein [Fusobacterium polymorphum]|uniref:ABC transporter ATP-binding protein n=1 Tax=Fusobacterium nucleatum subsp. polymorphum TaxID=76857 RepID=UPI0030D11EAF